MHKSAANSVSFDTHYMMDGGENQRMADLKKNYPAAVVTQLDDALRSVPRAQVTATSPSSLPHLTPPLPQPESDSQRPVLQPGLEEGRRKTTPCFSRRHRPENNLALFRCGLLFFLRAATAARYF
ncbi:hypothetical protein E2C01_022634 [Portunus trituberculatus]|uniref:Uncharacterized protein n=1 Tax=Portunus trituberculatus TaxID=210409 RepID=A0A5B7E9E2_PORTR|nr:hypothetical protein [Portunus trituberculatus]